MEKKITVDDEISDKNKSKSLFIFSTFLKKPTKADHLAFYAKKALNFLQNLFIQVLIFYYFDSKYYIYIQINTFSYAINKVLSQITLNNFS